MDVIKLPRYLWFPFRWVIFGPCSLSDRIVHRQLLYRGWVLRVNKDGTMLPTACGVRSPGGIGFNAEGDVFYTDNQGAWNGSSSLKWVKPGSFLGNPNGNIFFKYTNAIGPRPKDPDYTKDSRAEVARKEIATYVPPAVVLPHGKIGQSPTGIEPDLSKGKFGPFAGQTFVGEQTYSKVQRVFLEKVNGIYQGAAFDFLEGFQSGNIGLLLTKDGVMFTGGSNRGWGARGGKTNNFERVTWNGKVPFEIHEMRAKSDGFELTFTKPVDPKSAVDTAFKCSSFTYRYQKGYGSPEVDKLDPKVTVTSVAPDGKSLRIKLSLSPRDMCTSSRAMGSRPPKAVTASCTKRPTTPSTRFPQSKWFFSGGTYREC